jgi:hypothetical protein
MRFRRRPIATAAVIGGVAHAGAKAGAESAAAEAQQQEAPPPPPAEPAAGGMGPDQMEQLKQLAALHEQGVLTDEEFAEQKAKILG